MKTRILMGVLAIVMAAALIAGATMAWFTDSAEVPTAQFTAGTVEVNVDEEPDFQTMEGRSINNVNPGDCARVTWKIINEGTKKAELRVKLDEAWEDELSTENVYYAPVEGSKWVMYDEDGEIWLYYTGGPVRGTYNYENNDPENPLEPVTVELTLVVAFDGPATGNEYQGKEFTLSGEVQAIQATNGAPAAEWGDAWTDVTTAGYTPSGLAADYLAYCEETSCYSGEGGGDDEDAYSLTTQVGWMDGEEFIEDNTLGTISGAGRYTEGTIVLLLNDANPNDEWDFEEWMISYDGGSSFEHLDGPHSSGTNQYSTEYTMEDSDVIIRAIWDGGNGGGDDVQEYAVNASDNIEGAGYATTSETYDGNTQVTLTAQAVEGYNFLGWFDGETQVEADYSYTFTVTGDVTLVAKYEEIPAVIDDFDVDITRMEKHRIGSTWTKVSGNITGLKYDNGDMFSGTKTVQISIEYGPHSGSNSVDLNFTNGNASFSNVKIAGVYTENEDNVSVTIDGVTRP